MAKKKTRRKYLSSRFYFSVFDEVIDPCATNTSDYVDDIAWIFSPDGDHSPPLIDTACEVQNLRVRKKLW